ncbi:MAG: FAD-dependent oxidoreductase [Clostridiales bacterium]|nr:FAD-dependent oxidoreductase [Clostridiales bacterium]
MKKLLALLLTAALCAGLCSVSVAEAPAKTAMVPGTYEGSAQGMNDVLTVSVTVTEDKIEDVQVTAHQETPGIGAPLGYGTDGAEGDTPIAVIPSRIVENQSITVDSVTGATITSYAVMGAVKDALTKAGANTAEWQIKAEKAAPEAFEETADVVVLGGGGAGLAAAISALENGAESVIIVEKCGAVGGDTLVCGAIYNCPDEELQSKGTMTEAQHNTIKAAIEREAVSDDHKALQETVAAELKAYEEAGRTDIFDSDAWYALQTYDGGDDVAELDLVKVLTFKARDGYDWINSLGMEFLDKIGQGAGALWQRTHTSTRPMGTGFISTYVDVLKAYGDKVTLHTSTTAKSIVKDESGKVVGATAEDVNGNTYTFTANKGVVLATGGFAANAKMAQAYNTSGKWGDLSKVKTTNRYACSQGDGIELATAIGSDLNQMEQIQLLYLGNVKDGSLTKYPKRVVSHTDQEIFINKEGKRFVQEDGRRDQICLASLEQTDGMFYFLESGDGADFEDIDTAVSADGFSLRFLEEQGYIYVADTLEELVEKLNAAGANMDVETLKATIDAFNTCVENDSDPEFGRTLFSTKLEKGPWVATPRQACLHHTMGGVKIDTECRVLDTNGDVIPGLVAAGEVTGGIHGANRLGGNAVVDTVVFGKLAGETIVK